MYNLDLNVADLAISFALKQNRTEQKIYLLSNIASVNISSEELVFRQTNVYR